MWKDYSISYIKNNRASSITVMVSAFISALLLSLLCSLFYNFWNYEVAQVEREEGNWHGRIEGQLSNQDLAVIRDFRGVEEAVINQEESDDKSVVVDIRFTDLRGTFSELPAIASKLKVPEEGISYHYKLLNLFLVRDSSDTALRWVFPVTLLIVILACSSLILVIHNAFGVTMNARIHQFGIFSSIGATPKQIRTCLMQEAFALCALPIIIGNLLGILISAGMMKGADVLLADVEGRMVLPFAYHPLLLVGSLILTAITITISVAIPARKLSQLTPLEAIRDTGEFALKKKKRSRVLTFFFGIEGELAGNALKARKKALRTATFSLTLSFFSFALMMCIFSVMVLSQRETYFERYQNTWDVMVTVRNTEVTELEKVGRLHELRGASDTIAYQKAKARYLLDAADISQELATIGGLNGETSTYVSAPVIIMDDESFLTYAQAIGAKEELEGAIIRNRILDFSNPNFRERQSFTYLKGEKDTTSLYNEQGEASVQLPVLAYTEQVPNLREEYGTLDYYELVHFISASTWRNIKGQLEGQEKDTYIRFMAAGDKNIESLNKIESEVAGDLQNHEIVTENRLQEKLDNEKMIAGLRAIVSVFCGLLAVIGIGNVFSNTLGFVRQRKREFARYLSVGMTPRGIKKIFAIEALVIAGRPVLITVPITAAVIVLFVKASYLKPAAFLAEIPFIPILLFVVAIFGFVGLAYYLGAKQILKSDLVDSLRDDTLI